MKFQFSNQSGLHGREVRTPLVRFAYAPRNEDGLREYILVFEGRIPTADEEPDLYRDATISGEGDELSLRYDRLEEEVMLLTREADNRFRDEHPEIVSANEAFVLE